MWDVRGHENKVFKRHYPSQIMHFPKYHIIMYNLSSFSIISAGTSGTRLAAFAPSLLSPHISSSATTCTTSTLDTAELLNDTCDNGLVTLVWEHKFCPLTESSSEMICFYPQVLFPQILPPQHVWEVRLVKKSCFNSGRKEKNPIAITDFSSSPPRSPRSPISVHHPQYFPLLTFLTQR